jgi:hypothetical protein
MNLDQILDKEEAHKDQVLNITREKEITTLKAELEEAKERHVRAQRARETSDRQQEPSKERKKQDPLERLEETIAEKERIRKRGEEIIRAIRERARAAGKAEHDKEVRRDIENIEEEIKRLIAAVNERG